jgi:hypothetical protein
MAIRFSQNQWDNLKKNYDKWHRKELNRPLVPVEINTHIPDRPCPDTPLLSQANCHLTEIPAKDVIDRIDWELSQKEFLGDAFPYVNFDAFGPGVLSAFLGARLDNSTGRVWFHPLKEQEIDEIHLEFDEENVWFRRIMDLYEAGLSKWGDQVLMGMPDLGGTADIISTFRPGEKLLYDLYDHPKEVKRLIREIHEIWFQVYNRIMDLLKGRVQGYTDWSGLYQNEPGYIVQCDFCYMISPAMFDEFIKPDLHETFKKLPRNFYHLDGIGELPHLDSLLTIPELNGVQWVPGSGQPENDCWPEVYEKIAAADKLIQIYGNLDTLEKAALTTSYASRFQLHQHFGARENQADSIDSVKQELEKFGIS